MFEQLKSQSSTHGATEAVCEDKELGLAYTFYFYVYESFGLRHQQSYQILSRVFAVPQSKMRGRVVDNWSDCMRWEIYRATQHSVPVKEDRCND